MTRKEAIKILEDHNKWRCDNSIPSIYEATAPKKLTEAINTAISELKSDLIHSVSKCGHCKSKDIIDYVYCKDCLEFTPKQ